ncbi:hypothetical protein ENUP19_0036G0057 [Entamoeba nuttalli]|uniref:Rab3-GAP regulatory subunit N-terminal domain-containing protein n=1 Tax=Entamoeba nuttalli TaxID=412467 RepID=A0ABQ0D9P0_9EUKA
MEVCKRKVENYGQGKILSYCVSDDYNRIYILNNAQPHEVYEISCEDRIEEGTKIPESGRFDEIKSGAFASCCLICKIRCECESTNHQLCWYDNTLYILSIVQGTIIIINGHMSYRIKVPSIDGTGEITIIKNDVFIQAQSHVLVKTTLANIKESIINNKDFDYTEIDFKHDIVGLQLIHCKNAFRREEVCRILGKPYYGDNVIAVYGKYYPIVYRSLESLNKNEFISAVPDTRNIEHFCANPFNEKYVLLSDSYGRILVFDSINRFIVKTIPAMREARMCWIDEKKFVIYSKFRNILEIHNCQEQKRISFIEFNEQDNVSILGFRVNRVVVFLNNNVYILCFS